jgi:hypothetical protein
MGTGKSNTGLALEPEDISCFNVGVPQIEGRFARRVDAVMHAHSLLHILPVPIPSRVSLRGPHHLRPALLTRESAASAPRLDSRPLKPRLSAT